MDHFALAGDSLAVAKREGRLHRNFQGYSTMPNCDLVGLGVSAIGRIGTTHAQNAKDLPTYQDLLARGRLPVVRGLALGDDDLVRRDAIMALMCRGALDHGDIERRHGGAFEDRFAAELAELRHFEDAGLVELHPRRVHVTPAGWHVVRSIAMVFDTYLRRPGGTTRFSRIG